VPITSQVCISHGYSDLSTMLANEIMTSSDTTTNYYGLPGGAVD
jgi:hypothetical protein